MEQNQWHSASRKASNITMLRSKELLTPNPWTAECRQSFWLFQSPTATSWQTKLRVCSEHLLCRRSWGMKRVLEHWSPHLPLWRDTWTWGIWNPHALEALKCDPVSYSEPCCSPASTGCLLLHTKRSSAPSSLPRTQSRHSAGVAGKGTVEDEKSLSTLCSQDRQQRRTKGKWQKRK